MSSPSTPPVSPWHKRVLGWLGMEPAGSPGLQPSPDPGQRFPWEPVPPAPRPPQWGAANVPELLLGQDEAEPPCGAPARPKR